MPWTGISKVWTQKSKSSLNLNDDVFFDKKRGIVISIDTYNIGTHFYDFKSPDLVIKKILRSPISDLICKGVIPKFYFISGSGNKKTFTKKRKLHEGHDFSADIGTPIVATADGIVKSSRYFGSFGNYVEIDHGNGFVTCYGHLSKRAVKKGESIERGQYIGKVGNTGRSTAPHLHYEIRYNNKNLDPTNFYFDLSL